MPIDVVKFRGRRGESFADVARRRGEINGVPIAADATDQEVLDSFGVAGAAAIDVAKDAALVEIGEEVSAAQSARDAAQGFAADALDAANSVPVPATQTEVDNASAAKGVLALHLGKMLARLIMLEDQAGLPHVAQVAPVFDDFSGDGNLHGRALSDGSIWTVDAAPGNTAVTTSLTTASGLAGKNGAGSGNSFGHMTAVNPYSIISHVVAVVPMANIYDQIGYDAGGTSTKIEGARYTSARVGDTGNTTLSGFNAGLGNNPSSQATGALMFSGDVFEREYYSASAVDYVNLRINGRQIKDAITLSGNGWAITGKFGYNGVLDVGAADDFACADPDTDAWLRLYAPARVVQIEAGGTTIFHLTVEYGGTLSGLTYSIIDHATGLAVPGHDATTSPPATVTSLVPAAGNATALTVPASLGTGAYHVEVYRGGVVSQTGAVAVVKARGPTIHVGETIILNGQSNAVRLFALSTTTLAIAKPTEGLAFRIDAQGTVAQNVRYQFPLSANTPLSMAYAALNSVVTRAVSFLCGGLSGSLIAARGAGTATQTGIKDGIKHGGMNARSAWHIDGENDALSGDLSNNAAAYRASLDGIYDDLETYLGRTLKVVMRPIGACWAASAGSDADVEAMRRAQWYVTQGSSRYVVGGYCSDLQHIAADTLHIAGDATGAPGTGEMCRRMMFAMMKAHGLVVNDRNGPSMASVVKLNNQLVRVIYDLNGASGLEVANTGYAGDYSGSMGFATSAAFSALVAPTGVTINAVAGTQQSIDFAFTAGSFTGSAYVRGPWGKNPVNRTDDAAINADIAGKASMVRGLFAGEVSILVQPYFHASGNDYLVAV